MTDPISMVGLGLSIASLTGQALMGAVHVMDLMLKAKNLSPEYQYLNLRLQLERQRLWNWSDVSGLPSYLEGKEDALDSSLNGLNRHFILEVVLQVQTLVTEFVKVKGRYEHFSPGNTFEIDAPSTGDSDILEQFPGPKSRVKTLLRGIEITQQLPKRLRWAMWDQDKFKGLLDRLKELNDCLIDLVDNSVRSQIMTMTKETNINLLGLCNKVDDLSHLIQALTQPDGPPVYSTLESRLRLNYSLPRKHTAEENEMNKDLLQLTRFKSLLQTTENGALSKEQMRTLELNRMEIKILGPQPSGISFSPSEGTRTEALYHGQNVWVEWKQYRPFDHQSTRPDARILSRVQKLAALLGKDPKPASFRVPHCLGYFDQTVHDVEAHDESNEDLEQSLYFGYVFTKPHGVHALTTPVTLFDLLQEHSKPPLADRIALSQAISNCVYNLHSVNWLHKGLRSQNIIFFPSSKSGLIDYAKPYLTGFEYARPASVGEMTENLPGNPEFDIYRHPDILASATNEGYKHSYDIYSFGIILLEIAVWNRVADIMDPAKQRRIVLSKVRSRLLDEEHYLYEVSASTGSLFCGAVRCCLGGGLLLGLGDGEDEIDEVTSAKINRGFYEKVVKRLEDIRC
ncbi:hypothetical protein G7Y89_g10508 [Cudoniella acicularis]|uniref:Protein kinase domain-containing protein n=1 Tax=Cudoniella acicularis TaxID=354080 RepID=A0A8H4RCN2_9HELO|nr:hypothetical protein G7Y89_g10508 [Cudoniella acicularis]